MINCKKIIDKAFVILNISTCCIFAFLGLGLIAVSSKQLNLKFITAIKNIVEEVRTTGNITENNVDYLLYLALFAGGIVLIAFSIPYFIYIYRAIQKENGFDEINSIKQGDDEITYGIIYGNNTIVFIKAGMKGTYYGYNNKYLQIAKKLNKKHKCTVITASNPNGYYNDFESEMNYLKTYASNRKWQDYQIYYMGHSNGASLGIIHAYKYPEIKKLVCINGPLMINLHKLIPGIQDFNGEKMYLVYGSKDPSFDMLKYYSSLESDKIEIVRINGANHNFVGCLDLFIALPGFLFYGDKISLKLKKNF